MKKIIFIITCLLFTTGYSFAQSQDFNTLRTEYTKLTDADKSDAALIIALQMPAVAKKAYGVNSWQNIRALNFAGSAYINAERYTEAIPYLIRAYHTAENSPHPQDTLLWRPAVNLGMCYMFKHKIDSAEYYIQKHLRYRRNISGEFSITYLNEICVVADRYWKIKNMVLSRNYYQKSLDVRAHVFGEKSKEIAVGLLKLNDSLYKADSLAYNSKFTSLRIQYFNINYVIPNNYTFQQCDQLCRTCFSQCYYYNRLNGAMLLKDIALKQYGEKDSTFAYSMHMLGYLYEYKFKIPCFANYFYNASFIKNKKEYIAKFLAYENAPGSIPQNQENWIVIY